MKKSNQEKHELAQEYAAKKLGLKFNDGILEDDNGKHYRIMYRALGTTNVDLQDFCFDYVMLVNFDNRDEPSGMWRMTASQAEKIFRSREKYGKYQATQKKFKERAERVAQT